MAGTPEKILDYLLETMRSDSTLSDPVGEYKIVCIKENSPEQLFYKPI